MFCLFDGNNNSKIYQYPQITIDAKTDKPFHTRIN